MGNIAPDCNEENEGWGAFAPPREVTHWMWASVRKIGSMGYLPKAEPGGAGALQSRGRSMRSSSGR